MRTPNALAAAALVAALAASASAATIDVPAGADLQAAIDAADTGDVLQLERGKYRGDIDFRGKAITVRGVGHRTVLRGSGDGPVVTFATAEDERSVLESVRVTRGVATQGGGIYIDGASPVVVRCVVERNRARSQGSGIFVGGGSRARIFNNLVVYNRRKGSGDPHGIEIVSASPYVVNNTVARTDSNGLILRGNSPAIVVNNIFSHNGVGGRGRGICDFSGNVATIRNNVFHKNRISAILRGGTDYGRIENFERQNADPLVTGNRDGRAGFRRNPLPSARSFRVGHFRLRTRGRARDVGDDAAACDDADGSRNDAGHTGGAHATGTSVPDLGFCGLDEPS